MKQQIGESIAQIILVWLIVGTTITLPAACSKVVWSFYHQVIIKDQPVGQLLQK